MGFEQQAEGGGSSLLDCVWKYGYLTEFQPRLAFGSVKGHGAGVMKSADDWASEG